MVKVSVRLATRDGLTLGETFERTDRKTMEVLRETFTPENYQEYLEDCKAIGWLPPHER